MREEYEQLELDTRKQLDKAIYRVAEDAVKDAGDMIRDCGEAPTDVRNRHEAYGIAAEYLTKISKAVSSIKGDTVTLLGTLSDPNYPAIEAVSSICNSTLAATATLIKATAEMQRTLRNLYPKANICPVDYDAGASRVNQENRIKLMLAMAQENESAEA